MRVISEHPELLDELKVLLCLARSTNAWNDGCSPDPKCPQCGYRYF
jgi:hypothetical protein